MTEPQLGERLAHVRAQIEAATLKCGRLPHEVTLIAISKTHPAALIRTAIGLGATDIGENRVQEAEQKINEVGRSAARWHLVGASPGKQGTSCSPAFRRYPFARLAGTGSSSGSFVRRGGQGKLVGAGPGRSRS